MKLTSAQQQLVEDNHNLIYSFLNTYRLSHEDYYDLAAIGLCKAAYTFNPNKGSKFSCYAYVIMMNEVRQHLRKEKKNIKPSFSLDDIVYIKEDSDVTLADMIPDPKSDLMHVPIYFERMITELAKHNERYPKIVKLLYNGYSQTAIGVELNLSRSVISRDIKKIKKIVKEIL